MRGKLTIAGFSTKLTISLLTLTLTLLLLPIGYADPVETRYMRSDQHTINGLTAYVLGTAQTTASLSREISEAGKYSPRWWVYVYRRQADGTATLLASGYVTRTANGEGLQSLTLSIPETPLNPTDAIEVRVRILISSVETYVYFVTPQLGASKLNAATWTVYLYTKRNYVLADDITYATFYWGNSTYNSRIENFTWTPATVKEWHDAALWSFQTLTRKWGDINSFAFQATARTWNTITWWTYQTISRGWRDVASWVWQMITIGWHNITVWTFKVDTSTVNVAVLFVVLLFLVFVEILIWQLNEHHS